MGIELVDTLESRLFQIRTPPELPFKFHLPGMVGYADAEDKRTDPFVLGWKVDVWLELPVRAVWQYDERGALLDLFADGDTEGIILDKVAIYTFNLVEGEPPPEEPEPEPEPPEEPEPPQEPPEEPDTPPSPPIPKPGPAFLPLVTTLVGTEDVSRVVVTFWGPEESPYREVVYTLPMELYLKLHADAGLITVLTQLRKEIEDGNYELKHNVRG